VIPIKDVIPPRAWPRTTVAILGAGAVLFAAERALALEGRQSTLLALLNFGALWVLADNVEDRMGHWRFAWFYAICAAVTTLGRAALVGGPLDVWVVSSGAVAGVLGCYLALYPRGRVLVFFPLPPSLMEIPAAMIVAFFAALHVAAGPGPLVEVGTGLAAGASLSFVFRRPIVW
jgi:membrane associated rhomboid family serine protease